MSLSPRNVGISFAIAFAAVVTAMVWAEQPRSGGGPVETDPEVAADDDDAEVDAAVHGAPAAFATAVSRTAAGMSEPAHAARAAVADLREVTAEAIIGSHDDLDEVRERIELRAQRLRTAAQELEEASADPVSVLAGVLPRATTEPLLERSADLSEQAADTARILRDAADETEQLALAALHLTDQTAQLVTATGELPDDDDPQLVADAWQDQHDLLAGYREAAEEAARQPALAELAAVHLEIVDGLEATAEAATEHLDEGDIEPYEDARETQLERIAELTDGLLAAMQASLDAAVAGLEHAGSRTLALLLELSDLRRDLPTAMSDA